MANLKFVELPENFPRNLHSFQFLTGGGGVRNPFEIHVPQVELPRNHDVVVKRQGLCILFCDRYGFSSIMVPITGNFPLRRGRLSFDSSLKAYLSVENFRDLILY
jgi:hypothetical protein